MTSRKASWLMVAALFSITIGMVGSFGYAVHVSRQSQQYDQRFIQENRERIAQNEERIARACEARTLLALTLSKLAQDDTLIDELNALNHKYPNITPCEIRKEGR